jgi:hypothetical protein
VTWLLGVVPSDYMLHGVLRRHPVALAALARHHLNACVDGARNGYRTARSELGSHLPPAAIEAVLAAYRSEGGRLAAAARGADLVERALHGEVFVRQMNGGARSAARAAPGTRSRTDATAAARTTIRKGGQPDPRQDRPAPDRPEQARRTQGR